VLAIIKPALYVHPVMPIHIELHDFNMVTGVLKRKKKEKYMMGKCE
jgi:hypothetical protein